MGFLQAQFQLLQLPALEAGVMLEIFDRSEVMPFVQFKDVSPASVHQYNQEVTLGSATTASVILPTGTITEGAPTYTQVNDVLSVILDSVYVPRVASVDPKVVAAAIQAKAKTVARQWDKLFINGSGTAPQFSGLSKIASGSSTQDLSCGAAGVLTGSISFDALDRLADAVPQKPSFYVMPSRTHRALRALMRTAGVQPNFIQAPNLGAGQILTYNGIPVLRSDWISITETVAGTATCGAAYAVYTSTLDGLTGWYNGSQLISVSGPIPVNQSDMDEYQVCMRVGNSAMSTLSVARLYGVTN